MIPFTCSVGYAVGCAVGCELPTVGGVRDDIVGTMFGSGIVRQGFRQWVPNGSQSIGTPFWDSWWSSPRERSKRMISSSPLVSPLLVSFINRFTSPTSEHCYLLGCQVIVGHTTGEHTPGRLAIISAIVLGIAGITVLGIFAPRMLDTPVWAGIRLARRVATVDIQWTVFAGFAGWTLWRFNASFEVWLLGLWVAIQWMLTWIHLLMVWLESQY